MKLEGVQGKGMAGLILNWAGHGSMPCEAHQAGIFLVFFAPQTRHTCVHLHTITGAVDRWGKGQGTVLPATG